MRRTIVLSLLVLTLSACSGSGGSGSGTVVCAQQFWNSTVAVCLPAGWKVLSRDSLDTLGVPEETIAAFQYETPHAGQIDTVTATREPLSVETSTPEYSDANILAVSTLPDYQLIDKQTVTVDGEETSLHVFSARPTPDQPVRRYYQLSVAADRTGYTFTGSFPLSIQDSEAAEVQFILKNVSLKDPKGGSEE